MSQLKCRKKLLTFRCHYHCKCWMHAKTADEVPLSKAIGRFAGILSKHQ